VVFVTKGRGHGVGMSQEGAEQMAKAGTPLTKYSAIIIRES
jgi:SpoIID/LytB domain protein